MGGHMKYHEGVTPPGYLQLYLGFITTYGILDEPSAQAFGGARRQFQGSNVASSPASATRWRTRAKILSRRASRPSICIFPSQRPAPASIVARPGAATPPAP